MNARPRQELSTITNPSDLPDSPLDLARLQDAVAMKLASVSLTAMSDEDVLRTAEVLERSHRRTVGVDARLYAEVSTRGVYRKAGAMTPGKYLTSVLRLGVGARNRRVAAALAISPLYNYSGDQLDPALPATAAAVADGDLSIDHVSEIDEIPAAIPAEDKARAEAELAELSRELTPEGTREVGRRILAHLDPDSSLTDDADRARTRGFQVQPQDKRLMSKIRAQVTPALRAKLEAVLALWADLGMNNPDDPESPRGSSLDADAEALSSARERDARSQFQRNHDALEAMLDHLLAIGALGDSIALPAHLVVTASLEDLENRTGVAVTATGTRLPVSDIVDLVADATPWLEVFEGQSSQILYFGRGRRLASLPQRLALFGRDRGCTAPGCTTAWSRTQAHHMPDWQDGGPTDIDHLGGACGGHNRSVNRDPGGWETTILTTGPFKGRVGWRPTGSNEPWRVNHSLQPEKLLPAVRVTESGSAIEKWLSCRIPAPPPGPSAPPGVDVVRFPA